MEIMGDMGNHGTSPGENMENNQWENPCFFSDLRWFS